MYMDLNSDRRETPIKFGFLRKYIISIIRDPRDVIMVELYICVIGYLTTSLCLLYIYPSHLLGFLLLIFNVVVFFQRYILTLHYSSHRQLFKNKFINGLLPDLVSPFYGIFSGLYHTHHVIMHHKENNGWLDHSSTMPYQRDNVWHLLHYIGNHMFLEIFKLPKYVYDKFGGIKAKRFITMMLKLSATFVVIGVTWKLNPIWCLWALIMPYIVSSFALMIGNWSQHIFINADDPSKNENLTYNCINSLNNKYSYNDGYHIIHHKYPYMHWSEMPVFFQNNDYSNTLTFEGIGFMGVGIACLLGKYDYLYSHMKTNLSKDAAISLLKSRLKPIPKY